MPVGGKLAVGLVRSPACRARRRKGVGQELEQMRQGAHRGKHDGLDNERPVGGSRVREGASVAPEIFRGDAQTACNMLELLCQEERRETLQEAREDNVGLDGERIEMLHMLTPQGSQFGNRP